MGSPVSPDFDRLIAAIAKALSARGIPFMIIGGQAVLLHGEAYLAKWTEEFAGVEGRGSLPGLLEAIRSDL